MIQLFVDS